VHDEFCCGGAAVKAVGGQTPQRRSEIGVLDAFQIAENAYDDVVGNLRGPCEQQVWQKIADAHESSAAGVISETDEHS
jgi:hypothetical protein